MSGSNSPALVSLIRGVRPWRLLALLLASLAAGLTIDWLRGEERVIFPAPLPKFITVPPGR